MTPARRRSFIIAVGTAFTALAVAVGAGVVFAAVRYGPLLDDARTLRSGAQRVAADLRGTGLDLDRRALATIRADVGTLDGPLQRLAAALESDPGIALLRATPWIGPNVRAADSLVAAARDIRSAAGHGLDIGERYLAARATGGTEAARSSGAGAATSSAPARTVAVGGPVEAPSSSGPLPALVELIATSGASVDAARTDLEQARQTLEGMSVTSIASLDDARTQLLGEVERVLPLLTTYAVNQDALPDILGWTAPRRYLVLAQDPAELRPTGGFAGTYGIIAIDRGRITGLEFHDVYDLDLRPGLPYVQPPDALRAHLLGDRSWQLADANWSPDFPTSARDARSLYALESGDAAIDGVVGITTYAIDRLLAVTGPVAVPRYGVTVRSGETTRDALAATRRATLPGENRKTFLAAFASELFERVASLPPASWPALARAFEQIGSEREAAVWALDPRAEALIVSAGLDGGIRNDDGDFLAVVDANVAPASKLGVVVERSIDLRVRLDALGNAANSLLVAWTNDIDGPAGRQFRAMPGFGDATTFATAVRILVPERSRVTVFDARGTVHASGPDRQETTAGRLAVGTYLLVPPSGASLRAAWTAPYVAEDDGSGVVTYRLVIQKQPGTIADRVHVSIELPAGSSVVDVPVGLSATPGSNGTFVLDGDLRTDLDIVVRYRTAADPAAGTPPRLVDVQGSVAGTSPVPSTTHASFTPDLQP